MHVHLDVLGWLHVLAGWVGLLTGTALLLLAAGTATLALEPGRADAVLTLQLVTGFLMVAAGALMVVTGYGLVARRRLARLQALALAVPGLCALPFGTALSAYTLWALLNDDARRAFGRRPRGPALD